MPTIEQNESAQETKPGQDSILLVYHHNDAALWRELRPHLNMVARKQAELKWIHHEYPLPVLDSDERYRERFFADLSHTLLFVPGTSAELLDAFWADYLKDPRIRVSLVRASVAPIALRAAAGVEALVSTPLINYPSGPERDQACVEVALALEKHLLQVLLKQGKDPQAATMVTETATLRIL